MDILSRHGLAKVKPFQMMLCLHHQKSSATERKCADNKDWAARGNMSDARTTHLRSIYDSRNETMSTDAGSSSDSSSSSDSDDSIASLEKINSRQSLEDTSEDHRSIISAPVIVIDFPESFCITSQSSNADDDDNSCISTLSGWSDISEFSDDDLNSLDDDSMTSRRRLLGTELKHVSGSDFFEAVDIDIWRTMFSDDLSVEEKESCSMSHSTADRTDKQESDIDKIRVPQEYKASGGTDPLLRCGRFRGNTSAVRYDSRAGTLIKNLLSAKYLFDEELFVYNSTCHKNEDHRPGSSTLDEAA